MRDKNSQKNLIISIVFIVWFVASIAVMIYISKTGHNKLFLAILGQYLLVFGIAGISATVSSGEFGFANMPVLLFPFVGVVLIAFGFIMQYGSDEFKAKCIDDLPYGILGVFALIGIWLLCMCFLEGVWLRKRCTQRVNAKCINIIEMYHHSNLGGRRLVYCPVYEFYYNGTTYQVCDNKYTNMVRPEVGYTYEIFINHNKPKQFYDPERSRKMNLVILILGIAFLSLSIFSMIMYSIG